MDAYVYSRSVHGLSLRPPSLSLLQNAAPLVLFFIFYFFQSGSLAAPQISANLEQPSPHLKDCTPCPLYCSSGCLSAVPVCVSVCDREIQESRRGQERLNVPLSSNFWAGIWLIRVFPNRKSRTSIWHWLRESFTGSSLWFIFYLFPPHSL